MKNSFFAKLRDMLGLTFADKLHELFSMYFKHLASQGVDLDAAVKCSLTFSAKEQKRLTKVFKILKASNYVAERLERAAGDADEWILVVSKTEVQTVEKFQQKNSRLCQLACMCGVSFDKWDIEKQEDAVL